MINIDSINQSKVLSMSLRYVRGEGMGKGIDTILYLIHTQSAAAKAVRPPSLIHAVAHISCPEMPSPLRCFSD